MLAFHAPAAVRELFGGDGLTSLTERRAPGLEALLDELAATRTRGYSIDDEGVRAGVYCFGAPVFDAAGQPVAGVGVCVHKSALGPDGGAEHREAVQRAAATLTQRLGGRLPHASRNA
jgi:DNA-binding IclR family transcriptional regulator